MNKANMKSRILELYYEDNIVASNDAILIARFWEPLWDYTKSLEQNLSRLPRGESITRRRRELINEGKIKATQPADDERYQAFKNERDQHSNQTGSKGD